MSGKAQAEGSWGEYLQTFFDSSKVKVQNYAMEEEAAVTLLMKDH